MPIDGLDIDDMIQLLTLLAMGLSDTSIAKKLSCSDRTLRRRVSDLLTHLGAANRFQAGYLLAIHFGDRIGDPGGSRPRSGPPPATASGYPPSRMQR